MNSKEKTNRKDENVNSRKMCDLEEIKKYILKEKL
jgi:hypothetical protein